MKRAMDVVLAALGLVVLGPLLLLIAAAVKWQDGGPVLYRGERVGRDGMPFRMLKFRTMVVNADTLGPSSTAKDDRRITRVGEFLRRYKLDELPQLMNVLGGQMSFVGPRPQVPWAVALYTHEEKQLLSVRPGITDYASIKFSNEAELLRGSTDPDRDYLRIIAPEKIRLGLEYVKNRSLRLDLQILAATVAKGVGGDSDRWLRLPPPSGAMSGDAREHRA